MDAALALQSAARLVEARHYPQGNIHIPQWPNKYVGGSTLVSTHASDHATTLLHEKHAKVLPEDGQFGRFWAYKGNTLSAQSLHLEDGWVRETEPWVPIPGTDHRLQIHPDAVQAFGSYAVVAEHKAWIDVTPTKYENAKRQGVVGLACLEAHAKREGGEHGFYPIDYTPTGTVVRMDLLPFVWVHGMKPAGVMVVVVPEKPPTIRDTFPYTSDELSSVLAFYLDKAKTIVTAVETEDLGLAVEWDLKRGEFARPFEELGNGPHDLLDAAYKLDEARKLLGKLEADKDHWSDECARALKSMGKTKHDTDQVKATIRQTDGREYVNVQELRNILSIIQDSSLLARIEACIYRSKPSYRTEVKLIEKKQEVEA